jgi:hypothetical protein
MMMSFKQLLRALLLLVCTLYFASAQEEEAEGEAEEETKVWLALHVAY